VRRTYLTVLFRPVVRQFPAATQRCRVIRRTFRR
jgi:hypothetical protein